MRLDQIRLRRRPPDGAGVAAEVYGRQIAERVTVLVRIEPEAPSPRASSQRIRQSLRDLRLLSGEPVLASVVSVRGGRPGIHLESGILAEALGLETARIYFTSLGLEETRAEYYLERPEPLAWVFAARVRPTRRSLEEHRRACLKRIAAVSLDEKQRALLRRFVHRPFSTGRRSSS